jgi:hypothetical protein
MPEILILLPLAALLEPLSKGKNSKIQTTILGAHGKPKTFSLENIILLANSKLLARQENVSCLRRGDIGGVMKSNTRNG